MKDITVKYTDSCLVSEDELAINQKKLHEEIKRVKQARTMDYSTNYASVNLPFDQNLIKKIVTTVKEKKSLQPTILVVIGIGGSNLGTVALVEALQGKFYNEQQCHSLKIYFVDTVDSDYTHAIIQFVERELSTGNNILLNVISKSGTTTETVANFEVFLEVLKKHRPYNYCNFIVTTTDKNSALWKLSQEEKFTCLEIPQKVGGRYSVFSAVGLFPLHFLDIDITSLLAGAQQGFVLSTHEDVDHNPAALSALLISMLYKRGCMLHDIFIFSVELESLGKWYRQLTAESIGKKYNNNDELVNIGITPTVSIGSTDLHSVVQLYLAGPYNRFTTFITTDKSKVELVLPHYEEFEALVENIQKKSYSSIMNAILKGTQTAYRHDNRPFITIHIPEKSAYCLGQLMQIKMIEIMYLGFLMNINPFDQPNVEEYKKETRKIIATITKRFL